MTDRIHIRQARPGDARRLWEWRNDPDVRKASLESEEIPFETHARWYEHSLINPDRQILIGEVEGAPIGMVRFNRDDDAATVSILLSRAFRGKGLAKTFLSQAIRENRFDVDCYRAIIKPGNAPSISLFQGLGFEILDEGPPVRLELRKTG